MLRIDFRSLDVEPHPLDLGDWQLVTVDSGATHCHAGSGYNERRAECRAACAAMGIDSLRDATLEGLDGTLLKRVRHVITENERVDATARALDAGDLPEVAALLDRSHASLRDDYEASVPEVEATRSRLKSAGAAGARMVGGGFGGSVLALLPPGVPGPPGRSRSPRTRPRACSDSVSSSPSGRVNAHSSIPSPKASIERPANRLMFEAFSTSPIPARPRITSSTPQVTNRPPMIWRRSNRLAARSVLLLLRSSQPSPTRTPTGQDDCARQHREAKQLRRRRCSASASRTSSCSRWPCGSSSSPRPRSWPASSCSKESWRSSRATTRA